MAKYFGTNGIRGDFTYVNAELAFIVAQAAGQYFNSGKILVATDQRLSGQCLKHSVFAGLQSVGCQVIDLGIVTSPTAELMIKKLNADGLIIITASHLPPEFNAIKVVDGSGVTVSRERAVSIEKIIGKTKPASFDKIKDVKKYKDATKDHIYAIKKLLKNIDGIKKARLKIAIDCANATSCLIAPYLFRELGCQVISINSHVDGHFPGRESEPTKENVSTLIQTTKECSCDLGIAYDGDADRVVLVDEKGGYTVGDRVFALCAIIKLKEKKGEIISTVATSKAVEDVANKFNVKTIYTKIGAPYLSEEMTKSKAVLGGEEVGGVIWPELSLAKDGIFTAAKVVEDMITTKKSLSELLKQIPVYYNEKTRIDAKQNEKEKIIDSIDNYAKSKKYNVLDLDGIRINFDDSWVIVRASGTENYVRVFAESKDKEKAKKLVEEYKSLADSFRK